MVVIINNGPISGSCYQQSHSLLATPPGVCHPLGATPAAFNSATTLCCLNCCRPLTVHLRVGLLGCSPYRTHSANSPCGTSFLACIPCGRWFDPNARQNNWLGSSIFLNWNNHHLFLRLQSVFICHVFIVC